MKRMDTFKCRICHIFSAAHFVIRGKICESLHGHNYKITLEVTGELNEYQMVIDFKHLKQLLIEVCKELDHKFLLPGKSKNIIIQLNENKAYIRVHWNNVIKEYVIPKTDIKILPINAITSEKLAEYICKQIVIKLRNLKISTIKGIKVVVEELPGCSASFETKIF